MKLGIFKKTDKFTANKAINIYLYLIVFFVPLFFLPFNSSDLELNKTLLLSALALLALLLWLGSAILKKQIIWRNNPLNSLVAFFVLAYLIAGVFSSHKLLSLFGDNLSYGSILSVLVFAIFYFLAANNITGQKETWKILKLFLISSAIIIVFNIFQLVNWHILPFNFAKNSAFNLVANSATVLSIYLVAVFMIAFGFLVKSIKRLEWILVSALMVLNFCLLALLDNNMGWYLLIAGLFVWLVFISMKSKEMRPVWVILPTALLILSLFFLFYPVKNAALITPPADIKLDITSGFAIAESGNAKNLLIGSGPETFLYDFIANRPAAYNDTAVWQLRFDRSSSEALQLASTVGIIGLLVFLAFSLRYLALQGINITSTKNVNEEWLLKITLFTAFLIVFIGSFLYPFSIASALLFWLFPALAAAAFLFGGKEKTLNLNKSSALNMIFSLSFALLLIGAGFFVYYGSKIWRADHYLSKSNSVLAKTADLDRSRQYLQSAVSANSWFSEPYLQMAENLTLSAQASASTSGQESAGEYFRMAKTNLAAATEKEPRNAAVYQRCGEISQAIYNLGGSANLDETAGYYEKAVQYEQNNAGLYLTLASVYYTNALIAISGTNNAQANDMLKQAADTAGKAQKLKINYWEGDILLARILEAQNQRPEALKLLNASMVRNPNNLYLMEESGKMQINDNQLDLAEQKFLSILKISPAHANAHYYLAIIYEKKGEKDQAISQLNIVLKTNPNNTLVLQKLAQLKGE